ncbi:leucine-rich repeat-containing protein 15 [Hyalella azteca]|uniref:Leucine-rich repeat-containing protein 15 n=1 Tax=Hyalella azteca TaxID=294128 RepID=A0A8B7P304_HYAAZ|nr:leucine-rich repeat-containing protein 15 [Hyalella azteca]
MAFRPFSVPGTRERLQKSDCNESRRFEDENFLEFSEFEENFGKPRPCSNVVRKIDQDIWSRSPQVKTRRVNRVLKRLGPLGEGNLSFGDLRRNGDIESSPQSAKAAMITKYASGYPRETPSLRDKRIPVLFLASGIVTTDEQEPQMRTLNRSGQNCSIPCSPFNLSDNCQKEMCEQTGNKMCLTRPSGFLSSALSVSGKQKTGKRERQLGENFEEMSDNECAVERTESVCNSSKISNKLELDHKLNSSWYHLVKLRSCIIWYFVLFMLCCKPSLGFCPSGCMCDNVQLAVQCLSGRMDVVPILLNPGTIHLDLSHNKIKTIQPGFAFYHELQVLNVSYNEIVALGESSFTSQAALAVLVIKNNKISKLDSKTFVGLSSLEELDASNNYIELIHNHTFRTLKNLSKINLSGNKIRDLSNDVFTNLTNLRTLDLCRNFLREIPSNLFDPLINLKELYLCSNEITVLRDYSFGMSRRLKLLSLQGNKIESISEAAFEGLDNLVELTLYGNMLSYIPGTQMSLIPSLENLDLSLNLISYIPANSFTSLARLKSLSISQCSTLSRIDLKAFDTLSSLTSLELNFSPMLVDFQIEILRPLSDLRRLILRGNGIRTLSKALLDIGNLHYIDVRDNEFDCECSMKWFPDARRNTSLNIEIEDVICATPESLKGKSISTLTDYELRCYGHLITIAISAAITLTVMLLLVIAFVIYYKNCRKMKTLVHDNWPDKIVTTWRDTDYQKQVEDDEYTFHSLRGVHHIPVTVI